jgi:hypothetical protein
MRLTHILLTKFSVRQAHVRLPDCSLHSPYGLASDPLLPRNLDLRFRLFELLCVPGVLGQTQPDFSWVLLIDAALPAKDRERLRRLTAPHRRTFLHEWSDDIDLNALSWLRPYMHVPAPTHVVTTNIDNDDVVSVRLLQCVQDYLREAEMAGTRPPCSLVGWPSLVQWDFVPTRAAPFGYLKPWHRGDFPAATGYTLCCPSDYDLSVYAFAHTAGVKYFDPKSAADGPTERALRTAATGAGHDWRRWQPERHLHVVRSAHPQVVLVNHLDNDQLDRLFDRWNTRRPVVGALDFPEMALDFDRIRSGIRAFRRSARTLVRLAARSVRALTSPDSTQSRWRAAGTAVLRLLRFATG